MFGISPINLALFRRLLRESGLSLSPFSYWYGLQMLKALNNANHHQIRKLAQKPCAKNLLISHYFLALSYFLCGEYAQAEQAVKNIENFTKIPEIIFLYSEILQKQNRKAQARKILEECALTLPRKKVWVYLANLVDSPEEYQQFCQHLECVQKRTTFLQQDTQQHQRVNAALRAGLYDIALALCQSSHKAKKSKVSTYSDKLAAQALNDLKFVMAQQSIPFFLISGTLLGCIREGKLLGHDKDIDVGVWDDYDYEQLATLLGQSGYFYIVPTRTKHLVMLRHLNGIVIDVFIHYREENDYWHAGVKIKWHNSAFELAEKEFLGNNYLIPKDYDRYLTENYGDWKTPKVDFDSAFDTPNMEIYNQTEMTIYKIKNRLGI